MVGGQRRYRLLHELGRGGFGAVFEAEVEGEEGFRKRAAVKIIHADAPFYDEMARRLRDEARILGLVRHRAIVGVDELVRIDGQWAVAMEYVDGVSLHALLRAGPIPPAVALGVVAEVAGALHAAWDTLGPEGRPLRLVHRDVKPGNIQVTRFGEVRLLDFGIARADFDARESQTRSMAFGSASYMAPERHAGRDLPAGDVYSLGVVLWECLAHRAFARGGLAVEGHVARVEAAVEELRARLPEPLVQLVASMLATLPEERPDAETVAARAADLEAALGGLRLGTWAATAVPPVYAAQRATLKPYQPTLVPPAPEPSPPSRALRVAGGLLGFLAVAGLGAAVAVWGTVSEGDGAETRAGAASPATGGAAADTPADTPAAPPVEPPALPPAARPPTESTAGAAVGAVEVSPPSPEAPPATAPTPPKTPRRSPAPARTGEVVVRWSTDPLPLYAEGPDGARRRLEPGANRLPPGAWSLLMGEVPEMGGHAEVVAGESTTLKCSRFTGACTK